MTVLLLAGFAALLAAGCAPRLARAGWVVRAPGLALFVWQMLCAATLLSVVLAGLASMLHWGDADDVVCTAWRLCLDALFGHHGRPAQAVAGTGAALLVAMWARLLHAGWRVIGTERAQGRRLRTMMRLLGSRLPALDATVMPSPHPAAYLVPGGHRHVVITSGALRHLTADQVHAVMAHERAHATGRHYWLLRTVRMLHRAFPRVPMSILAHAQVCRLVELRADEVATRSNRPLTLARALVTMAETRAAGTVDGGDTAERLERLLRPPAPLPRATARALGVSAALLPAVPVGPAVLDRCLALH
ncbi:M56 family metallopeptidase [Dactylosporangium fulvum]|uniref:M56 family metallopeptidase n=1 Tax=Dactylosporangium fulvum TaxID=53359 RepID=UPI0031D807CC